MADELEPTGELPWLRNSLKAAIRDLERSARNARIQGRRSPSVARACAILEREYEFAASNFRTVLAQHPPESQELAETPPAGQATRLHPTDATKPREPGCKCHWEEGDSPCPVHDSPEETDHG